MNYTLPFYNKKGTISKIEEKEKRYQVYRYGINKNETYILEVPKKGKNKEFLINNYYNDLVDYLNTNKEKYEHYQKDNKNNKIKNKHINLLKIIGLSMLGTSIPLLLTYDFLGYIGITLDILTIPVILTIIKLTKEKKKNDNKTKFINKYNELKHKLKIYTEKQNKNYELTKYSSLMKDTKEPKRDINKVLERKKVS